MADEDRAMGPSQLHRRLKAEFDDVLRSSMQNRLKHLREEVEALCNSLHQVEAISNGVEHHGTDAAAPATEVAEGPDTKALCHGVARALRRAKRCVEAPFKSYGPSDKQINRAEPPEKDEGMVMEGTTLRSTLSSLDQSLASRSKQINHLEEQLKVCEEVKEEKEVLAKVAQAKLDEMISNPNKLLEICKFHLAKRKERVERMAKDTILQKEQAKFYQQIARQQRAFYLQSERIAAAGGRRFVSRHKAGEIALVHQPQTLEDDCAEMFDVGTAVANPYVCDSWPFEPNVLAKRTPQESSMPSFEEETEEELREADRGLRTNPFRAAGLRAFPSSDEEDDVPGTARSL